MTAPLALRAGGDRPHRPPALTWRLAMRAVLLALLALALVGSFGGHARAQVSTDTSPVVIGPGPAVPPPAPALPGGKGGKANHAKNRGGKRHKPKPQEPTLELKASCAPFGYSQSYAGWGPAVAYGGPVTVVYEAERCSTPDGSALDFAAEGTAQVFSGADTSGALLDTRPFLVTGTWRQPKNAEAWPLTWWSCSVPYASYVWEIPGLYTFEVSVRSGVWSLDVSSQGVGSQAVTWTHDGCA